MQEASRRRLDEINKPIREQLTRAVSFEEVRGYSTSGTWGFERKSNVAVKIRNTSTKPITAVKFRVSFVRGHDQVGTMSCADDDIPNLAPGEWTSASWSHDANQFIEADMRLFQSIDTAAADVEVQEVDFADGSKLKVKTTLKDAEGPSL